jgi:cardiolipin synthase A/B
VVLAPGPDACAAHPYFWVMRWTTRWVGGVGLAVLLVGAACSKEKSRPFRIATPVANAGPDFASALYQTAAVQMVPGHRITFVNNGRVFDAMVEEISRARSSVNIVSFIWRPGKASERVLAALTERARAGVACRVLVDPFGSAGFEKEVKPRLEAAGCKAHLFRPIPTDENLARNHRKLVLVDGRVGITGGFAIQDEWLGEVRNEKEWRSRPSRRTGRRRRANCCRRATSRRRHARRVMRGPPSWRAPCIRR